VRRDHVGCLLFLCENALVARASHRDVGERKPPFLLRITASMTFGIFLTLSLFSLGGFLVMTQARTYESDATVVFLVPNSDSANPFTYYPKSLAITAGAVVQNVTSSSSASLLAAQGASEDYQVRLQDDGNQWVHIFKVPNVFITVRDNDPNRANRTVGLLLSAMTGQLTAIQRSAGAPEKSWITARLLTQPSGAIVLEGRKSRALGAILVLAIIAASAVVGTARQRLRKSRVDHDLASHRRPRRAGSAPATASA
jgi:hypothetical protein